MSCLSESCFQGYLEEFGPSPLRQMMEGHLVCCAHCRAVLDRVTATHQRVDAWLAELSSPAVREALDVRGALTRVAYRIEFTSQPVAGKEIGGSGVNPKAFTVSIAVQSVIVAILMLIRTSNPAPLQIPQITLIAPVLLPTKIPEAKANHGGGAQHSPLPPLKGELPRPAPRTFIPPQVAVEHPVLVLDSSLIAPPDQWAAPTSSIGNPLGMVGGLGGLRSNGGLGDGPGAGIGNHAGDGSDSAIFNAGNGTTSPVVLVKVDPEYSDEARKAKYSGSVLLSIVVDTDGKAESIRVVRSLGMGLDEKAIAAIQKWRFRPGTNKGVPVRVRAQIEVNFRLL